jgi:hypothetical protein
MSGSVCVLAALLVVAPVALADSIYVCKAGDGSVVYRDFPCPPETESTTFGDPKKSDPKSKKPVVVADRELQAGMSKSQVRAILGSPTAITQDEGVDGRVDTWSYGASQTVQFDAGGHLIK